MHSIRTYVSFCDKPQQQVYYFLKNVNCSENWKSDTRANDALEI